MDHNSSQLHAKFGATRLARQAISVKLTLFWSRMQKLVKISNNLLQIVNKHTQMVKL